MQTPEQFGFDGFEAGEPARPRPLKRPPGPRGGSCRLFFALLPTAEAAAQLQALYAQLKAAHGLSGAMLALDRLHLTLDHLGDFNDFPEDIVAGACSAAGTVRAAPFTISLGHVVSFGRNSVKFPLVLKESALVNTELALFRQGLWRALAEGGVPGPARGAAFTPHVTLLYDPQRIAEQEVAPVHWTATDYVLFRSFVGQTRYEELGRWPLKA
ncbi:MAG: 2-5 ligase [Polaromonas sp.]|nr:2-5 ligase [Polaromonas sp.]